MILVTGAAGTVGSRLVAALDAAGHRVRALLPDWGAPPPEWGPGVEVVEADFDDRESLAPAVRGVEAIYLLVPAHPRMAQFERNVIDAAAAAAGSPRVVLHAAAGVDRPPPTVRFLTTHAEGFEHLRASGLPWTALAPNGFMQNVFGMVAASRDGVLRLPAGDAAVSYVDAADVAEAAARVLTTSGHEGATYTLTGPEAVTHVQIAERLSDLLGHQVRYQPVSAEEARAGLGDGLEGWLGEGMIELLALYGSGAAAAVSDDLPRLLGRPGRSLDAFLAANAAMLVEQAGAR